MSINLTSNSYAQSADLIASQSTGNLLFVIFGGIGILMGTTQIIVMILWKPLRTLDQSLIFLIAAGDIAKGLGYGFTGAKRLYLANRHMDEITTQYQCMFWLLFLTVLMHIVEASMLMISIDRALGLSFPIQYARKKQQIKIGSAVISVIFGLVMGCGVFVGSSADIYQLTCTSSASPAANVRAFLTQLDNVVCGVTVGVNLISCGIVVIRWRQAKMSKANINAFKNNIQLNALKTLLVVVGLFMFSQYASTIYQTVINALPLSASDKQKYAPVSGCLTLLRGVFDFTIYLCMCRDYRRGFIEIFLAKTKCYQKLVHNNDSVLVISVRSAAQQLEATKH